MSKQHAFVSPTTRAEKESRWSFLVPIDYEEEELKVRDGRVVSNARIFTRLGITLTIMKYVCIATATVSLTAMYALQDKVFIIESMPKKVND